MATKKRRVINGEGRRIIAHVYHYLKGEYEFTMLSKEPNCDLSHLRNITQRTADATGVCVRTVERILKEEKGLPSPSAEFTDPMAKRKKRANKVDIDSGTAELIRETLKKYHSEHEEVPTLRQIKVILNEAVGFQGCLETLRKLLLNLGYKVRKSRVKKKVTQ